jgi:hypothetical protein
VQQGLNENEQNKASHDLKASLEYHDYAIWKGQTKHWAAPRRATNMPKRRGLGNRWELEHGMIDES